MNKKIEKKDVWGQTTNNLEEIFVLEVANKDKQNKTLKIL